MQRLASIGILLIAATAAWADAVITLPTGEVTIGVETLGALGPSVGIADFPRTKRGAPSHKWLIARRSLALGFGP